MKQKQKSTETVIRKEERVSESTVYKYELILSESTGFSSYKLPLYSIRVEMLTNDGSVTYASSDKLFADLGVATDFFEKLIRSLASPTDLAYVVEDEFYKHR